MKHVKALVLCALLGQPALGAALDVNKPVPVDISIVDLGRGKGFEFQNVYGAPFYTYERDEPLKSNCVGACAETWIPVYTSRRDATDIGDIWKLIPRPDGSRQWTYRGKPLYTFGFGEHAPPTASDLGTHWRKLEP